MKYEIVAVDFDGTLCKDEFPNIGKPNKAIIKYVKKLAREGSKIILHTCREDGYGENRKLLSEAIDFCKKHEIPIYAVNENPRNEFSEIYNTPTGRKIYADLYIDDKALNPNDISYIPNIVTYLLLIAISVVTYSYLKEFSMQQRGYEAIGGEVFVLGLPLFYFILKNMITEIKENAI